MTGKLTEQAKRRSHRGRLIAYVRRNFPLQQQPLFSIYSSAILREKEFVCPLTVLRRSGLSALSD